MGDGELIPVVDSICNKRTVTYARVDSWDVQRLGGQTWIYQEEPAPKGKHGGRTHALSLAINPIGYTLAHVVLGESPRTQVHYHNGNGLDCRHQNLRTTPSEPDPTVARVRSKYRNVIRDPSPPNPQKPWLAFGWSPKKGGLVRIGYSRSEQEAGRVALEWRATYGHTPLEEEIGGPFSGLHTLADYTSAMVYVPPVIDHEDLESGLHCWDWF